MISKRTLFLFAIVLFVSLQLSKADSDDEDEELLVNKGKGKGKGILKKGVKALKIVGSKTSKAITGTNKFNKFDGGCVYADQMYVIHKCVYHLDNHMLLSGHVKSDSAQNVEIIVKMNPDASDTGVEKLKEYGEASFFRYGGDSRDENSELHNGEAFFSNQKCKEGKNTDKLPSFETIITTYKKEPICLGCVKDAIKYYERTGEVLAPTAKKCGCPKDK